METTGLDYEIALAKLDMVRIALLEGVRQCTAIWVDIEGIRLVDQIDKEIDKLHEHLTDNI